MKHFTKSFHQSRLFYHILNTSSGKMHVGFASELLHKPMLSCSFRAFLGGKKPISTLIWKSRVFLATFFPGLRICREAWKEESLVLSNACHEYVQNTHFVPIWCQSWSKSIHTPHSAIYLSKYDARIRY
jgi:hypothetical protein